MMSIPRTGRTFKATVFLVATAAVLAVAPGASAAPGDLDLAFGYGGAAVWQPSWIDERAEADALYAEDVAARPDGGYVVVGSRTSIQSPSTGRDDLVWGVLPNGDDDPSWGDHGIVTLPYPGRPTIVRRLANGTYLVAGHGALWRLDQHGALDRTFGTDGTANFSFGNVEMTSVDDLVVAADGAVVVLGGGAEAGQQPKLHVVRVRPNGTIDQSLSSSALVQLPAAEAHSIVPMPSGGFLIGAVRYNQTESRAQLVRIDDAGNLVSTFGTGGIQPISVYPSAMLRVGNDVVVGATGSVYWFDTTGHLDTSKGVSGISASTGAVSEEESSLALDAAGRLLVAGERITGDCNSIVLSRVLSDGSSDVSFGSSGSVEDPECTGPTYPGGGVRGIAVDDSGRIVVAGGTQFGTPNWNGDGLLLVRYVPDARAQSPDVIAPTVLDAYATGDITSPDAGIVVDAIDNFGVTGVRIGDDTRPIAGRPWQAPADSLPWTLAHTGTTTVDVQVRDAAGQVSDTLSIDVSWLPDEDVDDNPDASPSPATTFVPTIVPHGILPVLPAPAQVRDATPPALGAARIAAVATTAFQRTGRLLAVVHVNESSTLTTTLTIPGATAHRLGLVQRATSKPFVVGRSSVTSTGGTDVRIRVQLTTASRRKLLAAPGRIAIRMDVTARDLAGNSATRTTRISIGGRH